MNKPRVDAPPLRQEPFHPRPHHFVSLADWSPRRIEEILRFATGIKECPELYVDSLKNRVLLMMFQKPSLRTRLSFESAMVRLGGHAIAYDPADSPWAHGLETPGDMARTASHYVDAILARLFSHAELLDLANNSAVPVINGMTDLEHPCQALGDLLTLQEHFGQLNGLHLAYVGDARNNVVHSLLDACSKMGIHMTIGCPRGKDYEPDVAVLARAKQFAAESGAHLNLVHDVRAAVLGAEVVYTDTWTGYHVPAQDRDSRRNILAPFRVTTALMAAARPESVFMHSLPARRGDEIDGEVLDGPKSIVFAQVGNRLHTEKAILLSLIR